MVNVQEIIQSVPEPIKNARELILAVEMLMKLKKPFKSQTYISFVQLFSISLLSTFGECGGNFEICQHDYDICNDDKKKC